MGNKPSFVIHKYPLDTRWGVGERHIQTREDAKFLSVQFQQNDLVLWALVDTNKPTIARKVRLVFTGELLPVDLFIEQYIATAQDEDGLVWHVFITPVGW